MDIDSLFHSPKENIAKFAEMQVLLYREDPALQDYFHALDMEMFDGPRGFVRNRASVSPLLVGAFRAADRVVQAVKPSKIKTDILFSPTPYFGRRTENRLLAKSLLGLAGTGATILCLLPMYAPFRDELEAELMIAGHLKQVTFLDPEMPFNPLEGRMRSIAARLRGRADFEKTVQVLEPHGLAPAPGALEHFERTAQFVEAWDRLAPLLEFDTVVARCHWYDLCGAVCRTGMERARPVITFQQGVIGHSMEYPITATKFVTFGLSSSSVLADGNRKFFEALGAPEPAVEYFEAGSLIDTLVSLPDQFAQQTVLLVDTHFVPDDPWGTTPETQGLIRLAEKLLSAKLPLRRLVIRPHPHWNDLDLEASLRLVRDHRDLCELSHPIWSFEEDMRRSSIVVGIWSGTLTVASACGLPTIFLQTENGFATRDLQCFSPRQTLNPDAAFEEIARLLTDPRAYAEARQVALRNAGNYYANCANATLDGAFFEKVIRANPGSSLSVNAQQ